MRRAELHTLLDRYTACAVDHHLATGRGDARAADRANRRLSRVVTEVRRRGGEAVEGFLILLDHEHGGVRVWAASHCLEFDPDRAEAVLETLAADGTGLIQFSAEWVLTEWRSGRLTFP